MTRLPSLVDVERRSATTGLAFTRGNHSSLVLARDTNDTITFVRRDTDVHLPRRYDMSEMTQDLARDRMRQMRRDLEVARTAHGRYAARQRPRRTA
jgi:hypothetical protein